MGRAQPVGHIGHTCSALLTFFFFFWCWLGCWPLLPRGRCALGMLHQERGLEGREGLFQQSLGSGHPRDEIGGVGVGGYRKGLGDWDGLRSPFCTETRESIAGRQNNW